MSDKLQNYIEELEAKPSIMATALDVYDLSEMYFDAQARLTDIFLWHVNRLTGEKVKTYRDVMSTIAPNFNDGEVCVDSVFNVKTSMPDCERLGCTDCWNRPYKVGDNL
jgi:hypothetical protein